MKKLSFAFKVDVLPFSVVVFTSLGFADELRNVDPQVTNIGITFDELFAATSNRNW